MEIVKQPNRDVECAYHKQQRSDHYHHPAYLVWAKPSFLMSTACEQEGAGTEATCHEIHAIEESFTKVPCELRCSNGKLLCGHGEVVAPVTKESVICKQGLA